MPKVRVSGKTVMFWCPGCNRAHSIKIGVWQFNGDVEKPTFSPSVLATLDRR